MTLENGDKIFSLHSIDIEKNEEWDVSLQWFCNTGTVINDATGSGKYYDERSENLVYDMNQHKWYQDPLSAEYSSPNTQTEKTLNSVFVVWFLSIVVIFMVFIGVYLYQRIRGKNGQEKIIT